VYFLHRRSVSAWLELDLSDIRAEHHVAWARRAVLQTDIVGSVDRIEREPPPVYVMPNGERRRAVAVVRADPSPSSDSRHDRALYWWCGALAAVTIAGATAQSIRLYLTRDEAES